MNQPFWRLWNAAGSDGRGVIGVLSMFKFLMLNAFSSYWSCRSDHFYWAGVLEANFVEPAHDKQGFERTTVLARLETRLIQMQKTYWFEDWVPNTNYCFYTLVSSLFILNLLIGVYCVNRTTHCHKIGYAPRRNKKLINGSADRGNLWILHYCAIIFILSSSAVWLLVIIVFFPYGTVSPSSHRYF